MRLIHAKLRYLSSCQFLAPRLSAYFIPAYSRLSRDERIRWNMVGSSKVFFFSIFCPANVYGFISDNGLVKDPAWGTSNTSALLFGMVVGYLMADIVVLFCEFSAVFEIERVIHHIIGITVVLVSAASGTGTFFIFYRSLHELSNIFLGISQLFSVLRLKKTSPLVLGNGILLTLTFFLCRIAAMPGFWYAYVYHFWLAAVPPPKYVLAVYGISGLIIDILNVNWFFLIVRGLVRMLRNSKKERNQ